MPTHGLPGSVKSQLCRLIHTPSTIGRSTKTPNSRRNGARKNPAARSSPRRRPGRADGVAEASSGVSTSGDVACPVVVVISGAELLLVLLHQLGGVARGLAQRRLRRLLAEDCRVDRHLEGLRLHVAQTGNRRQEVQVVDLVEDAVLDRAGERALLAG